MIIINITCTLGLLITFKTCTADFQWVNLLVQRINDAALSRQLLIFLSNSTMNKSLTVQEAGSEDLIISELIARYLSFVIDKKMLSFKEEQSFIHLPLFKASLSSIFVVIFWQDDSLESVIDFVARLAPLQSRPRCLVISTKFDQREDTVEDILRYAWTKKFLDFTVLTQPIIYHFNPFFNLVKRQRFEASSQMFPNKLQNVNNYPIKLAYWEINPVVSKKKRKDGTFEIQGLRYELISLILRTMNFNLSFLETSRRQSPDDQYQEVSNLLSTSQANMSAFLQPHKIIHENLMLHSEENCEQYVLLVPVLPVTNRRITFKLSHYAVIISILIVTFVYLLHRLKLLDKRTKLLHVVQLLLNQPAFGSKSSRTVDRLVILTVIAASVLLTDSFFVSLINENYEKEVAFTSYTDVFDARLRVYAIWRHVPQSLGDDREYARIQDTVQTVPNYDKCVNMLVESRDVGCVTSRMRAMKYVSKYIKPDGTSIVKIAQPPFYCVQHFYFFEHGSPYVRGFMQVMRGMHESGLWKRNRDFWVWKDTRKLPKVKKSEDLKDSRIKQKLMRQMLYILTLGYSIGCLVFLAELIKFKFESRKFCFKRLPRWKLRCKFNCR